jgi:hypothetical protein
MTRALVTNGAEFNAQRRNHIVPSGPRACIFSASGSGGAAVCLRRAFGFGLFGRRFGGKRAFAIL